MEKRNSLELCKGALQLIQHLQRKMYARNGISQTSASAPALKYVVSKTINETEMWTVKYCINIKSEFDNVTVIM